MEIWRMEKLINMTTEPTTTVPGDRLRFELDGGEQAEAIAIRKEENGMLFIFTDCLRKEYRLHKPGKYPGWEKSELRGVLNGEILQRLPEKLKNAMVPFENGDLLRIPTEREIFGENEYGEEEPESVQQFECMKNRRNRIAFQGYNSNIWEYYWLQNRGVDSASNAANVSWYGYAYRGIASSVYGVRPLFIANL